MSETKADKAVFSPNYSIRRHLVALTAIAGSVLGVTSACGREPYNPADYLQAAVTLPEGYDPTSVVQCVEGKLAADGTRTRAKLLEELEHQPFGVSAQVLVTDLHAPAPAGVDGRTLPPIAVDCPDKTQYIG